MKALQQLTKFRRYAVFLDFEGTQFSHEIIAIGAVFCRLDAEGKILSQKAGFKRYVRAIHPIGRIVEEKTSISQRFLQSNAISVQQMLNEFEAYVQIPFTRVSFFIFGSHDGRMLAQTLSLSNVENGHIIQDILTNAVDYLAFISQYIIDENANVYSLVNYLKVFGLSPCGESHDPLNDAVDLKNLYTAFLEQPAFVKEQYMHALQKSRQVPAPVKELLALLCQDKSTTYDQFSEILERYLS